MARYQTGVGRFAGVAAALLVSGASARQSVQQAFDLQVMNQPAAAIAPDGRQVVYELHATNFARDRLTLVSVDVLDASTGRVLAGLRGEALEAAIGRPGPAAGESPRDVAPGMRAIVYLSVPADAGVGALEHRVAFEAAGTRQRGTIDGGVASVDRRTLPELGPPLSGGPWVAAFHPAWERGHRRVFYAVDGRARIPGRFAIDWMRAHDPSSAEQSDGHGADVLAVADARVVAARGDFVQPADNTSIPLEDGNGNFVTLDLGGGRYAFYEHLAEGVRVKAGDRVRKGDVIAALGATGHVTQPHLHFHVADAPSSLAAEGLPYALTGFRALGAYESIEAFRKGEPWRARSPQAPGANFSFPSPMMVVAFPGPEDQRR